MLRVLPVFTSRISTLVPGTTAPETSVTVPSSVALTACPCSRLLGNTSSSPVTKRIATPHHVDLMATSVSPIEIGLHLVTEGWHDSLSLSRLGREGCGACPRAIGPWQW